MWLSRSIRKVGNIGGDVVYEDTQTSINSVKLPAVNAPDNTVLYNMGIGGGVTFPALGFAIGELIYFDVQTSHTMKLNTPLEVHIHYTLPVAAAGDIGDNIKFQLDVVESDINGSFATVTGTPFTKEFSVASGDNTAHKVASIVTLPAVNTGASSIYKMKLTRIAASANDYTSDVYLLGVDCHYERDTAGSLKQTSKA